MGRRPSRSKEGWITGARHFLRRWGADVVALALPALVYVWTLCPSVYTMDSAELTLGARYLGLVHAPGHPLYLLLGRLFTLLPIGDVAYRVNLMSACFGALTVWLLFRVGRAMGLCPLAALGAVLLLAFSRSFWAVANVAEVYTVHTALVAGLLWLFFRWRECQDDRLLGWLAFGWGLSHGSHTSSVLLGPAFLYGLWPARRRLWRPRRLLPLAGLFLLGLGIFAYLPLRFAANPVVNYIARYFEADLTTPAGLWWMVSGKMFAPEFFAYPARQVLSEAGRFLALLWSDFLGIGLLVGAWGVIQGWRRRRQQTLFLLIVLAVVALFFINYGVSDKESMFLVPEMVWTLWVGEGLHALLPTGRRAKGVPDGRPDPWPAVGALAMALLGLLLNHAALDESETWVIHDLSLHSLTQVAPNAVLLAEWASAAPVEYVQRVEQYRQDVEVVNLSFFLLGRRDALRHLPAGEIDAALKRSLVRLVATHLRQGRPVYAFGRDPLLETAYEFRPANGRIYRLFLPQARRLGGEERARRETR